jgi:hypothetical protein
MNGTTKIKEPIFLAFLNGFIWQILGPRNYPNQASCYFVVPIRFEKKIHEERSSIRVTLAFIYG